MGAAVASLAKRCVLESTRPQGSMIADGPEVEARTRYRRCSIARKRTMSNHCAVNMGWRDQLSLEGLTRNTAPSRARARAASGNTASLQTRTPAGPARVGRSPSPSPRENARKRPNSASPAGSRPKGRYSANGSR